MEGVALAVPRIRASNIAEHKALTRTSLLDSAFKLFVSKGFSGTSLTDVASLARVGRTTLYEYFANKEELFLALVEERVPPLLQEAVDRVPDAPPAERIELIFSESFTVMGNDVDLAYVLFWVGRELPSAVRDRMWRALWPVSDALLQQCEMGVESGVFPEQDPLLLHQLIADLLVGAIDQVLVIGYSEEVAAQVLEARLRFLRHGINC